MWVCVDCPGSMVLEASLSATVLIGLIAVLMVGCRQPTRRVQLARAAIVASLLLVPLVWLSPLPRIDLVGALQAEGLVAIPAWFPASPHPDHREHALATEPWPSPLRWSAQLLSVCYLAGFLGSLAWLILGYWGLGWLTRRSREPSPGSLGLYRSLPCACPRGRPRLLVATRVRGPALIGVFRQSILIPPALDQPGASERLRLSLLHELAHAEESDPWFSLAGGLAQALWFFVPPIWWIRRRMRLDHEFLADRRAALGFGTPGAYASSLLELAAPLSPRQLAPPEPIREAEGSDSALYQRFLMLIKCPFPIEHRPPRWWRVSLSFLVAMATVACATLSPRRAETSAPPPSGRAQPPPASKTATFRMARLVVEPSPQDPEGLVRPFVLPLRLPDHFDLTFDVWIETPALAQVRVAGRLLGWTPAMTDDPTAPEEWHQVQVRRRSHRLEVTIDDQTATLDADPTPFSEWLTIASPPHSPAHFDNLILTWPIPDSRPTAISAEN